MIMADSILKSLSPLINIMRAFGLYFTRGSHVVQESRSPPVHRRIRGCSNWNAGRLYATIMLAMIWLNAARLGVVFHGTETVGAVLFVKIASLPGALLVAVLHTAYYVASHTGSLDRVFCQANFSVAEFSLNYSRRAKVVTVVCGIMITLNLVKEVYSFNLNANDLLPSLLINSFQIPKPYVDIIQVVIVILNLMAVVSWAFPQGMNYLVMTFLYDQFNKLSKEFTKCIGDRGEFSGNFEQFRRRHHGHQPLSSRSRSVSHDQQCRLLLLPDCGHYSRFVQHGFLPRRHHCTRHGGCSLLHRMARIQLIWLDASYWTGDNR